MLIYIQQNLSYKLRNDPFVSDKDKEVLTIEAASENYKKYYPKLLL